eukprot:GGOE01042809.1.p1 GENE.GGOE01042809.1~~GGOE01042809.1.p1  ORF type:complete len:414 (+),score=83.14 GGOE01042809.1:146-1243(+)
MAAVMAEDVAGKCAALRTEGNALFASAQFKEALLRYSEALQLNSRDAKALCNRAAAHLALGECEAALRDARDAAQIDPSWVKPYYRTAVALEGLGQWAEALEMYEHVIALEPIGNVAVKDKIANLRRQLFGGCSNLNGVHACADEEEDVGQCHASEAVVQATSGRVREQLDRARVSSTSRDHSIPIGAVLKGCRQTIDDGALDHLILPACRLTASMLLADHRAAAGGGEAGCCCLFVAVPEGDALRAEGLRFVSVMVFWVPQQPRAVFKWMSDHPEGVLASLWQSHGHGVPVTKRSLLKGDFDDARHEALQREGTVDTFSPFFLSGCSERSPPLFMQAAYLPVGMDGVPLGPSSPLQCLLATLPS